MAKVTLDIETFKALASATRLQVLRALDERRKTLAELSKELELNKATVHEHLALLVTVGLVKKRDDEGRKWIYYELTWQGERLLHPQETTTFAVLLGLGAAAAGGGVLMLGKALDLWWQEKQVMAMPETEALPPAGGRDAPESMASESDDAADSPEGSDGGEGASGGATAAGAEDGADNDTSGAMFDAGSDEASSSGLAEDSGGLFDGDVDGVLGLLLLGTAILLAVLAFVVRKSRRE